MNHAVPSFDYDVTIPFRNGTPTLGVHAMKLDQFAIHVATLKREQPRMMGRSFRSGTTYRQRLQVTPFTPTFRVRFYVTGRGTISLTVDGTTDTRDVNVGLGTSHAFSDAQWVEVASKYSLTHQDSGQVIEWSFSLTDAGGGATIQAWAVESVQERPLASTALP